MGGSSPRSSTAPWARTSPTRPVQLVWEHAYASPEAYRRYMVHPYHAAVIDRYLLPDAPERIVIDGPLGAGLYGYRCDTPRTGWSAGCGGSCSCASTPAAVGDRRGAPGRTLEEAPDESPDMVVSIMAANSMGSAWFDGVTPVMGPPRWTHLWEQGFPSLDALDAYRHGDSTLAAVERAGLGPGGSGGIVKRSAELFYEVSHGPGRDIRP